MGNKNFLVEKSGLKFKDFITLGEGELVIVYAKDKKIISINELSKENIKKIIIMP